MKVKRYQQLTKADDWFVEAGMLCVLVRIAAPNTFRWCKPIRVLVDTGANSALALPKDLVQELGLDHLPADESTVTTQSNDTVPAKVHQVNAHIVCDRKSESHAISNVPLVVMEAGTTPLVGLPLLCFYNLTISGGKLVVLGPSDSAFKDAAQWEPTEKTDMERIPGGCRLRKIK